jgi:hypothetical protein
MASSESNSNVANIVTAIACFIAASLFLYVRFILESSSITGLSASSRLFYWYWLIFAVGLSIYAFYKLVEKLVVGSRARSYDRQVSLKVGDTMIVVNIKNDKIDTDTASEIAEAVSAVKRATDSQQIKR